MDNSKKYLKNFEFMNYSKKKKEKGILEDEFRYIFCNIYRG